MTPVTSVLIVDDEPAVRELMSRWVAGLGLAPTTASNADEALSVLRRQHHDLAVIDMMMPGKNGLWLAGELRREHPHTAIVVATAYTDLLQEATAKAPIADVLVKPFPRARFKLAVDRGCEWRRQTLAEIRWHAQLSNEVQERVRGVTATLAAHRERGSAERAMLLALAAEGMPDVLAHSERVARFTAATARQLTADAAAVRSAEQAALFHDIGKIAMPESLLTKPSPLTPGEVAIMRRHVDAGAEILQATSTLDHLAGIVRASHEWFGGGGYPERLAGDAIPLASRIIAVADAYDAMTQDRSYRGRLDSGEAIAELLRCSPSQFDPAVLVAFLALLGTH
jgi:putative nucleotidyltransferase with HDIG domain